MHILDDLTLDTGVIVTHHEAKEVRFEMGTGSINVIVDSWLNTTARQEERPSVISRMLSLDFNPQDVADMIYNADGNIALAVYNALLLVYFENGTLVT